MSFQMNQLLNKIIGHWKITLILILLFLIGGILALAGVFSGPKKPKSDSPEDIRKFMATKQFGKLPAAQRENYIQKMRSNSRELSREERRKQMQNMTEAQRRQMFDNMRKAFEAKREKEMMAYFKMSKAEKDAWLDKEIADMDKRMAEMRQRRQQERQKQGEQKQNQNQQRPRPSEEQRNAMMKSRIETQSPESRALRQQYMKEMMARRKATGKTPQRSGRGGGPGGPPPR